MATSGYRIVSVTNWDDLKFSWSVPSGGQSVSNNSTKVDWKLQLISGSSGRISSTASKSWSVTINGVRYSGTNTIGIGNNATKTLASGSTTIKHDSSGKKTFSYSFSQQFSITFSGVSIGTKSGSGSGTLNNIARVSTLSASNGALGTSQTLTVTRHDSSFTHTITYKCGTATGTIATKSSNTSISWTPPLSLANQATTGTQVSVVFTIETFSGTNSIGKSTKTITESMASSVGPILTINASDPDGYATSYGSYVKGKSKVKIILDVSTFYGATITSYSTTIEGKRYTSSSFTSSVLTTVGELTISAKITDSRGKTASATATINVIDYIPPNISTLTANRCNSDGTSNSSGNYLYIKFSASISQLGGDNSASYVLQYKKTTEISYSNVTLSSYSGKYSVVNGSYILQADKMSSYNINIIATDDFQEYKKSVTGPSSRKLFSLFKKGLGIALGKVAELEGVFDINFKTRFLGGILQIVLENGTDFNDIKIPNIYNVQNVSDAGFLNCPISSGSATLTVTECGSQKNQILMVCSKTNHQIYERCYSENNWGEWFCVSKVGNKLLWSGSYYMQALQTITLSEKISDQMNGIVLVFSYHDGTEAKNYNFNSFFVHKKLVELNSGSGHDFLLTTSSLNTVASKYLYISDSQIKGNDSNENGSTTTTSGITLNNNKFVLRYVIGV